MNNTKAIFIKQLTSLIKVPSMIVQGVIFLLIALAFTFFISADDEYECFDCIPAYVCEPCEIIEAARFRPIINSTTGLFAVIFVGLALVGSASAIVLEDKTTTNLRFMAMADVKPFEYLPGTVAAMMIVVFFMLIPFALVGGYFGREMFWFMSVGFVGGFVSVLLGSVIGLSKVPALSMPISMVLGLGPSLGSLNESVANAIRFTFIQQVNIAFADLNADLSSNFLIIGVNGIIVFMVFVLMHRKNKFNL